MRLKAYRGTGNGFVWAACMGSLHTPSPSPSPSPSPLTLTLALTVGMGSLHTRKVNSDAASPEEDVVVNTGVTGAVVDKGTMMKFMPYFAQSVRHGLQVNALWHNHITT